MPLGERVAAIESRLDYIEKIIARVEEVAKERDQVARREHETFQRFVAEAQRVLADALKEYKSGSNEWRDALNDALTKGVQQPEFRATQETLVARAQANADRIGKLESKDAEDKALTAQLKEKEKEIAGQEREAMASRNWKIGIFVTIVTILINVAFQVWSTRKP